MDKKTVKPSEEWKNTAKCVVFHVRKGSANESRKMFKELFEVAYKQGYRDCIYSLMNKSKEE